MKELPIIAPDKSVEEAAKKLAVLKRGVIGVVSGGHLVGIFTDRDFTQKIVAKSLPPSKTRIDSVMSYPVITISKKSSIPEAALKMSLEGLRHLVIANKKEEWKVVTARCIAESMQTILSQTYKLE